MDDNEQQAIDAALTALVERVLAEPHIEAELQRARREFHGEGAVAAHAAAERRFLEWFVLERQSEVLGDVPADVTRLDADESVAGSLVGAFAVVGVATDCATAKDLQDDQMLDLVVPTGSLAVGDLVVGRLYVVGTGRWLPSTVASIFRPGGSLGEAFAHDVQRLELDRRLQQVELEHVLLRPQEQAQRERDRAERESTARSAARATATGTAKPAPVGEPLERLEARLDGLLQNYRTAGDDRQWSATEISERLARTERPGVVMGPLLDEVAFETEADLDAVRRVLLEIWNSHHPEVQRPDGPAGDAGRAERSEGPPGETLGERMVRHLDDGLRSSRDLDGVFAELEEMAGLEPGSADDGSNPFDGPAADGDESAARPGGGDLTPLVEEFLWETEPDEVVQQTLRTWVELQGNAAVPRVDLDLVTGEDLMRVLLHVFLGAPPAERSGAVRAAYAAFEQFYAWVKTTQELDVEDQLTGCRGALLDQLDRLTTAGRKLSTPEAAGSRPAMFEIEEILGDGFGMRTDEGDGHWLEVDGDVLAQLCVGDLLLGALADGPRFAGPVVVLPADARALLG